MPKKMQCPFCHGTKILKDMESEQERYYCRICQKYFLPEESAENEPSKYSGKTEHPMRIFLSYGHPESEICKRIYAALKARGHDVWFDKTELEGRVGLNWRSAIQQGVKESDEVVACLSEHSMRERGVCLDELGIAIGVKGGAGCIHSVLLGKEEKIDPPPTITHDQWLDMRDWQEQLAKGEAEFAPWLQAKMQELFESLESEKNRKFSGEIETIRTRLNVQYATSKQEKLLLQPFVGREWLQEKVDAWLGQAGSEKMSFVSGEPGVGKSAFAAHYAHHNPHAAAILMCEHDMESYNSAKTVIQTLAFLLACRIPEYRQSLLGFLPQEKAELANYSEKELFERLIQNPFSRIVDGNFEPRAIVLDGLDECGDPAQNMLAKTLDEYADRLPHWLHILVVGRATAPMLTYTKNARRIPILADSAENLNDIQAYFIEKLQKTFSKDPSWNAALERMTQRSQGVFLYAELLCDLLLSRGELLPENDYPDGLDAVFARWFGWFFPNLEEYKANWRPAIGCLLGAPEPLPEQTLQEIFAWGENELADFKLRLKVLLREGKNEFDETTLVISHDYMREWLQRNPGENIYYASPADGKKKIADALWAKFEDDPKKLSYYEALALLALAEGEQRKKLGASSDFLWRLFHAGDYCKTWGRLEKCREIYESALQLAKEQNTPEARRDLAVSHNRIGNILQEWGKLDAALENYQKSLAIDEELAKEQNTPQIRRNLSASYNNIAIILEYQGNFSGALRMFQKSLEISKELAQEPNTPDELQNLSVRYFNLSSIMMINGDLSNALENYYKSLEIAEELAKKSNIQKAYTLLSGGYEKIARIFELQGDLSTALEKYYKSLEINKQLIKKQNTPDLRKALSISYSNVARIIYLQGNLSGSLKNYQKSLKLSEQLMNELNTPKSYRDFSAINSNVAIILEEQGHFSEALERYQVSLSIDEQLVKKQNIPESRRDLAVGYNNVGHVLKAQCKLQAAQENYQKCLAIREELAKEQNTPQSSRDLAAIYNNMGNIVEQKGDLAGALEYYEKSYTIFRHLKVKYDTIQWNQYLQIVERNIARIREKLNLK